MPDDLQLIQKAARRDKPGLDGVRIGFVSAKREREQGFTVATDRRQFLPRGAGLRPFQPPVARVEQRAALKKVGAGEFGQNVSSIG